MALKFQYNKTYLQQLNKELKVRVNALPTLQAKESALRLEVKKAKKDVAAVEAELATSDLELAAVHRLWPEFRSGLLRLKNVAIDVRKIAGVKTPVFRQVEFAVERFSLFAMPGWLPAGFEMLKGAVEVRIKRSIAQKKVAILEYARKKTTQKVNLYEKVQIPEYNEAILKIKRFLEDDENLAKSAQKILKARMALAEAVV